MQTEKSKANQAVEMLKAQVAKKNIHTGLYELDKKILFNRLELFNE